MQGKFISLEGGEGTGKTTQIELLSNKLKEIGINTTTTREPGGTIEAEKIRNLLVQRDGGNWDPLSEALLLFAARREHLVKLIWPEMEKGNWVITDRFADSSRVFQGYGMDLGQEIINRLYRLIAEDFCPDLTIVLDIDAEIGLRRSNKHMQDSNDELENTEDRYELMGLEFHKKLRDGFLKIAELYPRRCIVINAEQSIEEIHAEIMAVVSKKFGLDEQELANG